MFKFNNLLPSVFGGTKEAAKKRVPSVGKLESDSVAVDVEDAADKNTTLNNITTPTASADMTAQMVRQLSDPNYNSLEVTNSTAVANGTDGNNGLATSDSAGATTNTMNVHSAQQQVVMQFTNASNLHFGSVYNFNSAVTGATPVARKGKCTEEITADCASPSRATPANVRKHHRPPKTTTLVAMMQSQDEPNHRMLDTIASHLGGGWKRIMRELGHSDGQIEQAIIDHQIHGGIKEVIYQLLLQWIQNADDDAATLGRITTLLWDSSDQYHVVEHMKFVFKSELKEKCKS